MRVKVSNDEVFGEVCRMLSQGKTVRLPAKGGSMRPFISGDGDILVISPLRKVRLWNVVLARIPGRGYLVHRVIGVEEDEVVLMGDANLYGVERCRRVDVVGCVNMVIRNGRERPMSAAFVRCRARIWHWLLPLRCHIARSVAFCHRLLGHQR